MKNSNNKETQLAIISGHASVVDPYPGSLGYSHIKLYNHLLGHLKTKHRWCGIDCMTKKFKPGRINDTDRSKMRRRLVNLKRWARETMDELISTEKAVHGKVPHEVEATGEDGKPIKVIAYQMHHGEIVAAQVWDRTTATQREIRAVDATLKEQLIKKEITKETYDQMMKMVYPELKDQEQLENNT